MNIRLKKNILTDDGVKFESEIIELNDELADKIPTSRKTGRK